MPRYDKVAVGYMTDAEAALLYTKRARELEANQRYKEAEKMYLTVKVGGGGGGAMQVE